MDFLLKQGYILEETQNYTNGGKSEYYSNGDVAVIVDYDIYVPGNNKTIFSYSLITDKQNKYIKNHKKVYRLLAEDSNQINMLLEDKPYDVDCSLSKIDRGDSADTSPLELLFETNFRNVYGTNSLKYLTKEYCINDDEGHNYFLDYLIRTREGDIAVEENGISYHHPQIIGKEKYRRQLQKQNACAKWGIKLYRFSTEDCQFQERIEDDIRAFLGKTSDNFIENKILLERKITLYDHQVDYLKKISEGRAKGENTFLIVLPTASGKSKIIEEDIKSFSKEKTAFRALIVAPNVNIVKDWNERIKKELGAIAHCIDVKTNAGIARNYTKYPQDYYNYIVIDEAHHAVAPVFKRVVQYFTPEFLVGITATPERFDRKRLENIFGSYESNLSLQEAMESGIIATARVFRIETNINLSEVRINGKEYVNADLEKHIRVNSRNELITNVIKEYFCDGLMEEKQGVIFCVNVKHTKEMAKLLNEAGISAMAYSREEQNHERIMASFKKKEFRFICACNMISEGWDYPELGILVMARPTLSKVLYMQQIGRGLRKTDNKKDVYVIDVVDEYGAMAGPCCMHSIFMNCNYVPFAPITQRSFNIGDIIEVDGLHETIERIIEIDINDFEEKYGDYLSQEQLAREYFVSTDTITSWIKKDKIKPTISLPFGSKKIHMFSPEYVEETRERLQIPRHDDTTIYDDFFNFLEERDYSMSYKIVFLTNFIKNMNSIGEVDMELLLDKYKAYYQERIDKGLNVDKPSCPYTTDFLLDNKKVKQSMLTNPFEKFERKRFMYYSKDLNMLAMNNALFSKLTSEDIDRILKQMKEDLEKYNQSI